jgi:glutamate carboxypeptidase
MRPVSICTLAVAIASTTAAQTPATKERDIVRAVDSHSAEALALLERVVNVNSGTLNVAGVRRVGDIFKAELDALGFRTRWVDGSAVKRAGHLVAEHPGPGPKILIIGHLDTVFEPSSPFQKFVRLNDSTAKGPGIIDMKGGDVIALFALRALKDVGLLDSMNVTVVFNGDEEDSGSPLSEARRALVDAARGASFAIGFENGPGDPKFAVISRRSSTGWRLTTTGVPGHSSQIFRADIGAGAVFEASRILNSFRERLSREQYLAFNPGLAIGGSRIQLDTTGTSGSGDGKSNVVAERMTVTGDLRTISPEQFARAKRTMEEIVAASLPQTKATIVFDEGYPPMAPTDGNRRLLAMYDQVSRDLGLWPVAAVDPSRACAADVAFVAGIVPMIIDGVGLSGTDDHSDKETADLRMLPVQTKRAAVLLSRLREFRP